MCSIDTPKFATRTAASRRKNCKEDSKSERPRRKFPYGVEDKDWTHATEKSLLPASSPPPPPSRQPAREKLKFVHTKVEIPKRLHEGYATCGAVRATSTLSRGVPVKRTKTAARVALFKRAILDLTVESQPTHAAADTRRVHKETQRNAREKETRMEFQFAAPRRQVRNTDCSEKFAAWSQTLRLQKHQRCSTHCK